MPDIPTIEPLEITAGDTVKWTRDLSADYPANDGWTLTYYITGPVALTKAASASGTQFAVTLTSGDTQPLSAGHYKLQGYVTKSGERYSVYSAHLKVHVDPSQLQSGADVRSHARKCLDAIKAVIERRATRDDLNYQINGTGLTVGKIPHAELLKFLQFYQSEVLREEQADKLKRGEGAGNMILVRF